MARTSSPPSASSPKGGSPQRWCSAAGIPAAESGAADRSVKAVAEAMIAGAAKSGASHGLRKPRKHQLPPPRNTHTQTQTQRDRDREASKQTHTFTRTSPHYTARPAPPFIDPPPAPPHQSPCACDARRPSPGRLDEWSASDDRPPAPRTYGDTSMLVGMARPPNLPELTNLRKVRFPPASLTDPPIETCGCAQWEGSSSRCGKGRSPGLSLTDHLWKHVSAHHGKARPPALPPPPNNARHPSTHARDP